MLSSKAISGVLRAATVYQTNGARCLSISATHRESIKIQDTKDFNEKVKNSKTPVIVDFFATWCNPCRLLTPRLESVIAENKGKVMLAKVDIDEHSDLALDYEVASVPVLVAIKDGKVQHRLVGLQETDKLRKWVQEFVSDETKASAKA